MRLAVASALVGVVLLWVAALMRPEARNVRFLTVFGLLSAVIIAASIPRGMLAFAIELLAIGASLYALWWPDRVGLSSLDPADLKADAILVNLSTALDGPGPEVEAMAFRPALEGPPFTTPGSPWRNVARCYRTILARLGDEDPASSPDQTPLLAFRRGGRHFWQLALDRRVIGRPHQPSAWDEEVLLRCILDAFNRLMPPGASLEGRDEDRHVWEPQLRSLIDDMAELELMHPWPSANRRLLRDRMEATLAVTLGDHSDAAVDRLRITAAATAQQWQVPEEDITTR